jgi:hypothetical protein
MYNELKYEPRTVKKRERIFPLNSNKGPSVDFGYDNDKKYLMNEIIISFVSC